MRIHISDPADPRVAPFRDIKERDLVGRQGLFIAEGEVVLRMLAVSNFARAIYVLLSERQAARLDGLTSAFDPAIPIYIAAQTVMDAIAGFPMHRGVLALGERVNSPSAVELVSALGPDSLVMALVGIANHDNMGGIFRNAAAFGVDALLLDQTCCDPLYRKAIRVSVGGVFRMPFARLDGDLLDLLDRTGLEPLALTPTGETPLHRLEPGRGRAVLLGAEGPGLSSDLLDRVRTVSIPMTAGFDSLNVATTSGIVLHHLTQGR
jgi:tRNA G18 (ribose-2'-O)-methylase SpoU